MSLPAPMDAGYLRNWGRHTHGSPLYAHLVEVTASSPELLGVLERIVNRPPPNVYFAAIQFLLMQGGGPQLAAHYPSLTEHPLPIDEVGQPFTEFVLGHREEIVDLANARYTQTNECRRCIALLPAVMTAKFDSFHLVDIGTSAGLNLVLDRYSYTYRPNAIEWGPESPVTLVAELRGDTPTFHTIAVGRRIGIDLNIVDPSDPTDRRWLDALIWPEHAERRIRLRDALDVAAQATLEMIEGNVLDVFGDVLDDLPRGDPVVIMNSFALNQLESTEREVVAGIVDQARADRPIHRVSMEYTDSTDDWARLQVGDGTEMRRIGIAHPHGEWLDLDYQVRP